jgi:hypothetical protein
MRTVLSPTHNYLGLYLQWLLPLLLLLLLLLFSLLLPLLFIHLLLLAHEDGGIAYYAL